MTELDVVVRCRNEMPHVRRTLEALLRQEGARARILFLDCESTDGSREEAQRLGLRTGSVPASSYMPGAVLNRGMRETQSEIVAFVNADAVPLAPGALAALVEPLRGRGGLAATWARQVPRPDADALTAADYRRAFGEEPLQLRHGSFFSMAASAVRRDAWAALPFDEGLRYSEDCDWSTRASALGWRAAYVPQAIFEHSHAYGLRDHFRRRKGEGRADAAIHRLGPPSVLEVARPLAGSLLRDLRGGLPAGVLVRVAQAAGLAAGRREAGAGCDARLKVRRAEDAPLTACRDPGFEARVLRDLAAAGDRLAHELGPRLRALLLVGSFARGEGGAALVDGRLQPDNDYDLVAVVNHGAARLRRPLAALCRELSASLKADVEAWPLDEAALPRLPPTLFWLDAARGGVRLVRGSAEVAARLRPLAPRQVPLEECGRLLANRAVGLALTNLEVAGDARRALRHGHKSILACGDALLLAVDRYAATLPERAAALESLRDAPAVGAELSQAYRDAVEQRFQPGVALPEAGWYARIRSVACRAHLAFEAWRAGTPLDPLGYAEHRAPLYRQLPDVRSGLVAALLAAAAGDAPLLPWLGHPRERLARAAVALAYGEEPGHRAAAARLLGSGAAPAALHGALLRLAARAG